MVLHKINGLVVELKLQTPAAPTPVPLCVRIKIWQVVHYRMCAGYREELVTRHRRSTQIEDGDECRKPCKTTTREAEQVGREDGSTRRMSQQIKTDDQNRFTKKSVSGWFS